MSKKYRFFYHYFKAKGAMSVHWRGRCYVCQNVICEVPCETKWRPTQPRLIMQGWATRILLEDEHDKNIIRIV